MIIAVDGPAGAGKSTVCKLLAKQLGYVYLDTGAMYRAVAWALSQNSIPLDAGNSLEEKLPFLPLRFALKNNGLQVTYQGQVLEEELRSPRMAQQASQVSRHKAVRLFLTEWQRQLASTGDVVAEGRDMTTVVFPHAPVKVFLTADLRTRAQRRHAEYTAKGRHVDYSEVELQMQKRDEEDSQRALAPLRPAPDAFVLNTGGLDIHTALSRLMEHIAEKTGGSEGTDSKTIGNIH